ncbi:cyclin-D-binding Myb-like transcription factor 1 [Bolinopsis microptera]|uniref:cyclin-D-binding Myb-like transcription factor 1 n=1 Tax=Bolinopsis microptera TaxID=2820187 RepID=UPI003078EE7C
MPRKVKDNGGLIFKTGKWMREEEEILKTNARGYLQENDLTLPALFALSAAERKPFFKHCCDNINRAYINVYKKAMRMFDEKNHLGSYTDKEISLLKKLSSSVDDDHKWKVIGEKMGRSANSVRDRATKIGAEPKNRRKRKWTPQEKDRFKAAVEKHGHNWQLVSNAVGTRTPRQCLKYSVDQRNSENRGESMSMQDQVTMVELLSREPVNYTDDVDWKKIADKFPGGDNNPAITPLNLKCRFRKLIVYRIPFHYQLSFNDIMDILMDNFVKPFKDGRLDYGNELWNKGKRVREHEEVRVPEGGKKVKLEDEDHEVNLEGDVSVEVEENVTDNSQSNDVVPIVVKGEMFTISDDESAEEAEEAEDLSIASTPEESFSIEF